MITDNRLTQFKIRWTEICTHTYERLNRSKWRIKMDYACGAAMALDNMPDDLIQCLVRGAHNSGIAVESNIGIIAPAADPQASAAVFVDIQKRFFHIGET